MLGVDSTPTHTPPPTSPTRLVKVSSGSLVTATAGLSYWAISHTWNWDTAPWHPPIPGVDWSITALSSDALDLLFDILKQYGVENFWLDCLCIDQRGMKDKEKVVSSKEPIEQNYITL